MKVILCGCNGRMGHAVVDVAKNYNNVEIVGGIDLSSGSNYKFPVFNSASQISIKPDVIIDFSNPKVLEQLLKYAVNSRIPVVLCTTGYSDDQIDQIRGASKHIPVFCSRNMSIGINFLIEIVRRAVSVLGEDFDVEIIERHHNKKIDSPSGTAIMIADEIDKCKNNTMIYEFSRHLKQAPRSKNEIGIHSVRGGNIVGDHEVLFIGKNESIKLSHFAQSREIFAEGAIEAAKFLKDRQCGIYDMSDMINQV